MVKEKETIKKVICASCDVSCSVKAHVRNERVVKVSQSDNPLFKGHICMKGVYAPKGFAHPDRIRYPLKRVGEPGFTIEELEAYENQSINRENV